MATWDDLELLLAEEHHLVVVSTARRDGSVLSSVVNCGVMPHPVTGERCLAFVSAGTAARNGHLRRGAPLTVVARRGWRWAGATGRATLIGPDDPTEGFDGDRVRLLLRSVFEAAGGSHDDYDEYDRVMLAERRVGVFVVPERFSGVV
jgi:PPOX class probable F420-dependent enzyme